MNNVKSFSTITASILGFFLVFQLLFSSSVNNKFPTVSFMAFSRTSVQFLTEGPVASGKWASSFTGISVVRRKIAKPKMNVDLQPDKNIVVIVDESVRRDHLSLNGYERETTPFLDKLNEQKILLN